ncbi:UvrD-helicase domain-containing protein [Candidatus Kaiserbacteria bacterium]|nr:UvrD-helicase domain-containing protein [Candidatus Kaiserbacteria bacterium]
MKEENGLNAAQKEAVEHPGGPLLVVAGAGAGKTRTIAHRIARLIERGVAPREILALTFTNKAAGEMRERIFSLVPKEKGAPLVTTFHSLGVRLLREFHKEAGIPEHFTIWDRDDSSRTLKKVLESLESEMPARAALAMISREKGNAVSADEYAESAKNFRERLVAHAWAKYEKRLAEEGALDFDDLLIRLLSLLRRSQDTLAKLRARFQHLLIDEYQDTNRVQYEIASLLASPLNNICVVGDIDQNIYSWRGADIGHLLRFEQTFPGARVVILEQNYRSTRTILAAAASIIEKNERRLPKNLFTENETGEALTLFPARDEVDEAWFVVQYASELIASGTSPAEIAVLYRENFQSRALEEAFLHVGIPYRVIGTRFFERKEVKDVLSYLRAALHPQGRTDIARIIGTPARGIGPSTLAKMFEGTEHSLPIGARMKIENFRKILYDIRAAVATLPASEAVRFALERSGIETMLKKDSERGNERLENVHELVNLAVKFDFETPPTGIDHLLEEAALQSEQDEVDQSIAAVSLMTAHASKGLEFDVVFITGLEQGLFPSTRESEGRDEEEERRLFYVALTRARTRVFLSFASARMKYGSREYAVPSEFLGDIDPRLLQHATKESAHQHEEQIIT